MKLYVDLDVSEHTRIGQCCNDDDKISSELAKFDRAAPQSPLTSANKICTGDCVRNKYRDVKFHQVFSRHAYATWRIVEDKVDCIIFR